VNADPIQDTFLDADDTLKPTIAERRSRSSLSTRSLTNRHSNTDLSTSPSPPSDQRPSDPIPEADETTPRVPNRTFPKLDNPKEDPPNDTLDEAQLLTARHARNISTAFSEVSLSLGDHAGKEEVAGKEEEEVARGRTIEPVVTVPRPETSGSRPSSVAASDSSTASTPTGSMAPPLKPAARTFSSPLSWFTRKKTNSTTSIPPTPPPVATAGRKSGAFGATLQPGLQLDGLSEEKNPKETLQERFKLLRMKQEAGIDVHRASVSQATSPVATPMSRKESEYGLGIDTGDQAADMAVGSPTRNSDRDSVVSYSRARGDSTASSINPNLAAGTVSGMMTSPAPVDWDLWQSVVNEGPSAVSKSSPADFNRAVAGGIPSTIRGVVWQVLAQSENKGLEMIYRELVNRGTDKEIPPSPSTPGTNPTNGSIHSNSTQKESVTSSSSSVHSDHSTPATTNGMTSPSLEVPPMDPKLQAKRAKEDLAVIKKLEKTIKKDLGSRSNYSRYATAAGMQDALFGICKAYALYDEGVGYAQGMNFIVMPLLFNMPEEEAFCLLVRLMNHYGLRETFIQDMPGLHVHLEQFSRLLDDLEPALAHHLRKRGLAPLTYATQWFMTLFAYRFPLQLVLRIYDLILSEGLETAILKFALALMHKNASALLAILDMAGLKTFLTEKLFDAYIDPAPTSNSILESGFFGFAGSTGVDRDVYRADLLVQDACAIQINPTDLATYKTEYLDRTRQEREQQIELETLRINNAQLTAAVRKLEEAQEKLDSDHIELAGQMIRSKMVNEELRQENTELTIEVEQLKLTVASQPGEVEERMREETERIKTRISEVVGDNRVLEEQLKEMEGMLVGKSMELAEVCLKFFRRFGSPYLTFAAEKR